MQLLHTKDTTEPLFYLPATLESAPADPNKRAVFPGTIAKNPMPITSVGSCCSARVLSYVYGEPIQAKSIWASEPTLCRSGRFNSIAEYVNAVGGKTYYAFPFEILAAHAMEKVLPHLIPSGGQWTWFLADRICDGKTLDSARSTITRTWYFMRYIQDNPQLGQILISQPAMGNHGGLCVGAVWTPRKEGLEKAVASAVEKLNNHAAALEHRFRPLVPKSKAADEVAKLW